VPACQQQFFWLGRNGCDSPPDSRVLISTHAEVCLPALSRRFGVVEEGSVPPSPIRAGTMGCAWWWNGSCSTFPHPGRDDGLT